MTKLFIFEGGITSAQIDYLKKLHPPGARVKLHQLNDPHTKIESGTFGTVSMVDDVGTVHVDWESGQRLGLVMGEDQWSIEHGEKGSNE